MTRALIMSLRVNAPDWWREIVAYEFERAGGDVERTAARLGVSKVLLWRWRRDDAALGERISPKPGRPPKGRTDVRTKPRSTGT